MRKFAAVFSIAIAALVASSRLHAQRGPAGQPAPPPPKIVKVHEDFYVIENANATVAEIGANGGNIAVYITPSGVILVDSKNDRMHEDVVAKVKSLTDKPIKYVLLTHNHTDHAGGAAKMAAIGANVIISSNDRDNMARAANPAWLPEFSYSGRAQLSLGGKEAQLIEARGHTRGDTIVYFPAARIACGGDLFGTVDEIPFIVSYPDGGNW